SLEEIEFLFRRMGQDETKYKIDLRVGELVKIIDGPFKDYEGKILEIDNERGRVRVLVPIFGRETPLDLDVLQIKKVI
ncbi:MAG: KOW motif-containing protein, partial [bacterium]|nr:KOW motif-containing protein [bacterium]